MPARRKSHSPTTISLETAQARREFRRALLIWYDANHRTLPWRISPAADERPNPWRVLVSEIMLQQTTVATVRERYERFLNRFPTTSAMAASAEGDVLEAWSGLGYYSRARRLRQAAIELEKLDAWPESARELKRLPGLGPYTSAAVASIAFNDPTPAVDTNVLRVTARLSAEESPTDQAFAKRRLESFAANLLDPRRPGDFNQAMMELGATTCTPREPNCAPCPVAKFCEAHRQARQTIIPAPPKRKNAWPAETSLSP